jgi:hypothetical protein
MAEFYVLGVVYLEVRATLAELLTTDLVCSDPTVNSDEEISLAQDKITDLVDRLKPEDGFYKLALSLALPHSTFQWHDLKPLKEAERDWLGIQLQDTAVNVQTEPAAPTVETFRDLIEPKSKISEFKRLTLLDMEKACKAKGMSLYQTNHFVDRFNMRAHSQMAATRAFEVAVKKVLERDSMDRPNLLSTARVSYSVWVDGHCFLINLGPPDHPYPGEKMRLAMVSYKNTYEGVHFDRADVKISMKKKPV